MIDDLFSKYYPEPGDYVQNWNTTKRNLSEAAEVSVDSKGLVTASFKDEKGAVILTLSMTADGAKKLIEQLSWAQDSATRLNYRAPKNP